MTNIITGNKLVDETIFWYQWKEGYDKVLQQYKERVYIKVEMRDTDDIYKYQIDTEMPDFTNMRISCIKLKFICKVITIKNNTYSYEKIITNIYSYYSSTAWMTDLYVYRSVIPFSNSKYIIHSISLETERKRLIPYVLSNGDISSIPLLECLS